MSRTFWINELPNFVEAFREKPEECGPAIQVHVVEFGNCWAMHTMDSDRSRGVPTYFFLTSEEAQLQASGSGWCGRNSPISIQAYVRIGDDYYILHESTGENIKMGFGPKDRDSLVASALAKLTSDERKVLGLEQ